VVNLVRWLSPVVLVAGFGLGTLGESSPAPRPGRSAGGYLILAADFHVHAFPGDGALPPWLLRRQVERAGLDVYTLTNHNQVMTSRLAGWLAQGSPGPLVIVGEEVTAPRYHLVAVGVREVVSWEQPAAAAVRDVHAQGGIAIAAHPGRDFVSGWDDEAVALLDGVERAHGGMHFDSEARDDYADFYARARSLNQGIAPIGSSDFHTTGVPGWCRTYVLARERTVDSVLEAVREGRTVAADATGVLYGDPGWLALVESVGGFIPRPEPPDRWRRLSIACAWLGVLGLVVFGWRRTSY